MSHRVTVGAAVPRRNNPLLYFVGALALSLSGWQLDLRLPDAPKMILIVAPHTSNWDFVLCMLAMGTTRVDMRWMGKQSLFQTPWGWLLRWLGGIPVNRSAAGGLVRETTRAFEQREKLVVAITPEGTRGRVQQWKRGFYHIAEATKIPVVAISIDYKHKRMQSGPVFAPSGDWDADMAPVFAFYRDVTPRHPQAYSAQ